MRWRRESRLALGLALVSALLLGASLPGAEGAGPSGSTDALRARQTALAGHSHSALLTLYALDARLAQARGELDRIRARVDALTRERESVRREVAIVEANLHVSQRMLGAHLRSLYENGEPDALAVLLGASSLDDAVTTLDALERSARQSERAVTSSREGRDALERLAARLEAQLREARALEARAERTTAFLARARAERVAYIASLARERRLTQRQIASLDSHARRVVERSERVQAESSVSAEPAAVSVVDGVRTLRVTATGYSLPGRTSTGLPVGIGVVAVDPAVIPLGTRLAIPGYGEGVAADTGSAVQGARIDLWFPTLADALAWGRRTVTITLH